MDKDLAIKDLKPGDLLCYCHNNPLSWAIRLKTWHNISHVAVYIANNHVFEATLKGVGFNSFDSNGLVGIYRPLPHLMLGKGLNWGSTVAGQGYDWLGVLGFFATSGQGKWNKQFCSELATRFYRKCGLDPYPRCDADTIAPFQLAISPVFKEMWQCWRN